MKYLNENIKIEMNGSYKLGMNEVVGLKGAMATVFKPVQDVLKEKVYWDNCELDEVEYKGRDGFIPHSHNRGGLMIGIHVPKCESYEFDFLEFGECEDCDYSKEDGLCGYKGQECASESEGHLDAYLRIWFKFEGIDDEGNLQFYINACGGNGDAPYFRVEHLTDLFEASFTCKSLAGLKRAASKHIKALVKLIESK